MIQLYFSIKFRRFLTKLRLSGNYLLDRYHIALI